MKERKITEAFTTDKHFEQAGFDILMKTWLHQRMVLKSRYFNLDPLSFILINPLSHYLNSSSDPMDPSDSINSIDLTLNTLH
jgi:hypothetical protein